MPTPPREQRAAVQAVIFERKRFRQLIADLRSIDVLMNLNNPNNPGGAPNWVIQATGELNTTITEAARRCKRVGAAYRAMSRDLADVELPARDKGRLRLALVEQAAAWEARGEIWGDPTAVDPDTAVRRIGRHTRAAAQAFAATRGYLPSVDRFNAAARRAVGR